MSSSAVRYPYAASTDHPATALPPARVLPINVQVSTRTLQMTAAGDKLRDTIDRLKLDYSLTSCELSVLLAGETYRHAHHELGWERQNGQGDPLATRYLKPDDPRTNEALAAADGILNAALDG